MALDIPAVLERVVLPVVRALIHEDESVDGIGVGDDQGADLLLTITIEREPFRWTVHLNESPETEDHARSRLASDLQDFIAESRFGRGRLRPHPF